jgi:hypothetical protein
MPGSPVALARSHKQTEKLLWLWAAIFLHVFQASTTTSAERKQMLRLVIREVIVDSKRADGQVWVQINWQAGAQEQFWYQRRVHSYAVFAGAQALEQRIRELNAAGMMDAQIAATLEREGVSNTRACSPHYKQNRLSLAREVENPDSEAESQST